MTPDRTSRQLVELLSRCDAELRAGACPLTAAWREAEAEAERTYDAWRRNPNVDAYVVYLAAEERAAVAQDELGERASGREAWTATGRPPAPVAA